MEAAVCSSVVDGCRSVISPAIYADIVRCYGGRKEFTRGFDFFGSDDDSEVGRREQFVALIDGWWSSPFWGNGLGAAASVNREYPDQPWAYELVYAAMLFQFGILGFALYVAAIAWIYWKGIQILKSGGKLAAVMLPTLVGMSCFLIATGTNSYLFKFDYIW